MVVEQHCLKVEQHSLCKTVSKLIGVGILQRGIHSIVEPLVVWIVLAILLVGTSDQNFVILLWFHDSRAVPWSVAGCDSWAVSTTVAGCSSGDVSCRVAWIVVGCVA